MKNITIYQQTPFYFSDPLKMKSQVDSMLHTYCYWVTSDITFPGFVAYSQHKHWFTSTYNILRLLGYFIPLRVQPSPSILGCVIRLKTNLTKKMLTGTIAKLTMLKWFDSELFQLKGKQIMFLKDTQWNIIITWKIEKKKWRERGEYQNSNNIPWIPEY